MPAKATISRCGFASTKKQRWLVMLELETY